MANDIDDITPPISESFHTALAPTIDNEFAPNSEDVVMAPIPDQDHAPINQAFEPADKTCNTFSMWHTRTKKRS
jgi:hypothetical protein